MYRRADGTIDPMVAYDQNCIYLAVYESARERAYWMNLPVKRADFFRGGF